MTHTQGRLKLGRISHSEQSAEIDAESNTAWMDAYPWEGLAECRGCDENKTRGAAVMEANARRMVACWNACIDIDTDTLVELGPETTLVKIAIKALEKVDEALMRNAELLEALKLARGALRQAATDVSDWGAYAPAHFQTKHKLADDVQAYNNAADSAHAAIAKAEGAA